MREELIQLKTVKLAKEKGFDWECDDYININTGEYISITQGIDPKCEFRMPSQSLLQRWLREIHKIHISINPQAKPSGRTKGPYIEEYVHNGWWSGTLDDLKNPFIVTDTIGTISTHDSYEEALETGLQKALNLI